MANKDRQKRSARKARAAERAEKEAAVVQNAVARGEDPDEARAALKASPAKESRSSKEPGFFGRIGQWFRDVFTEMKRVVWPTPKELRNYSFAVIGLLIFFGVVVWIVDTGVVAGLVQYSKIGPNAVEETPIVDTATAEDAEDVAADESANAESEAAEAADESGATEAEASNESSADESASAEAEEETEDTNAESGSGE